MRIKFLLILIMLSSCNQKSGVVREISQKDSLKLTIMGNWGARNGHKAVFRIMEDSIKISGSSITYPYTIINKDMVITTDRNRFIFKNIFVVKDTLFFLDEETGLLTKSFKIKEEVRFDSSL